MSSKVSKPGAFETSPARAANRRSNSSTRSAGTVMALMRTMLMSPFYRLGRQPGFARGRPEGAGREKMLMEGSGRTVGFVVYSSVGRGNIPMRHPFGGSAKIAVIPGRSRDPQFG